MTVIAVASDGRRCCMAADSLATNNGAKVPLKRSKIIRLGPILIGADGSLHPENFFRFEYSLGKWGDVSLAQGVVKIARDLWEDLSDRGVMQDANGAKYMPGSLIVAKGKDFCIVDCGGAVVETIHDFWAIGSGCAEARGAMLEGPFGNAEDRVMKGVRAAIALDDGCGPPIRTEWT